MIKTDQGKRYIVILTIDGEASPFYDSYPTEAAAEAAIAENIAEGDDDDRDDARGRYAIYPVLVPVQQLRPVL